MLEGICCVALEPQADPCIRQHVACGATSAHASLSVPEAPKSYASVSTITIRAPLSCLCSLCDPLKPITAGANPIRCLLHGLHAHTQQSIREPPSSTLLHAKRAPHITFHISYTTPPARSLDGPKLCFLPSQRYTRHATDDHTLDAPLTSGLYISTQTAKRLFAASSCDNASLPRV